MSPEDLWEQMHTSFEQDDGSFPEISLVNLSPAEVATIYSEIRMNGHLVDPHASFWDYETGTARAIADVPAAAARVVSGRAAGFTFMHLGASWNGIEMPELGFQIFADTIVIFYRMGAPWNARSVHALFSWLRALIVHASACRLDVSLGPSDTFPEAWSKFTGASQ